MFLILGGKSESNYCAKNLSARFLHRQVLYMYHKKKKKSYIAISRSLDIMLTTFAIVVSGLAVKTA